jgi:hypothetical protein
MTFGPWLAGIDRAERLARTRAMRALAGVFCHGYPQFAEALRAAETSEAELERALQLLDELPALNRRRLLASYGAMAKTTVPRA